MSEYGEKSAIMSSFAKGLQMDVNPMAAQNDTLSDALNATFVTMRGNELVLQNDFGNGRIEKAFLPPGYVPVGMKEYGGILYIASYNPITNKGQIGSFPSPERNVDSQEIDLSDKTISWSDFIDVDSYENDKRCTRFVAKLDIFGDRVIHSGDKFTIYFKDGVQSDSLKLLSNYYNTEGGKVKSPKKNTITIKLAVIDSENNLRDITNQCKRFDESGSVIQFNIEDSPILKFNSGYFIQNGIKTVYTNHNDADFITERNKKAINTYNNKISGQIYLIVELNIIQSYSVGTRAFKKGENGYSKYAIDYINQRLQTPLSEVDLQSEYLILFEHSYQYNCPDGFYTGLCQDADSELLNSNPALSEYGSYFGESIRQDIYGSFLNYSLNKSEVILDFDSEVTSEFMAWETIKSSPEYNVETRKFLPKYNVETGLYEKTQYSILTLNDVSEDQQIFNYYCEPAMSYSRLPQLSTSGSINLQSIGNEALQITAWRYFNDTSTDQTHIILGLKESLPDNCTIQNVSFEVFDLKNIDLQNPEPAFILRSQRSTFNGEYQELYNLRPKDSTDVNAFIWDHLYLIAVVAEIETASDTETQTNRELLGFRYFLATTLLNNCFFNTSKLFAKDYLESFWNPNSSQVDPEKYLYQTYEAEDGCTYYSNFKDDYSDIFSVPLEVKLSPHQTQTIKFSKLGGADAWVVGETMLSDALQKTIYQNVINGELSITPIVQFQNSSEYPFNELDAIVNSQYTIDNYSMKFSYPHLRKNYAEGGQNYTELITKLEENAEFWTKQTINEALENENELYNVLKLSDNKSEGSNTITITYDLQYLSELYGKYETANQNFNVLYQPFLKVHEKGFLGKEYYPEDSCKPWKNLQFEGFYSADRGGVPLFYQAAFNPGDSYVESWITIVNTFGEKTGINDMSSSWKNGFIYKGWLYGVNSRFGIMISPCHNLLKSKKFAWFEMQRTGKADNLQPLYSWYMFTHKGIYPPDWDVENDYIKTKLYSSHHSTLMDISIPIIPFMKNSQVAGEVRDINYAKLQESIFANMYGNALELGTQSILTWASIYLQGSHRSGFRNRGIKYFPYSKSLYKIAGKSGSNIILDWKGGSIIDYTFIRSIPESTFQAELENNSKKTYSIDNWDFDGSQWTLSNTRLGFRTEANLNEYDDAICRVDLDAIETLDYNYRRKLYKNETQAESTKARINSFLRSSSYIKTLSDYLNSFCVLTKNAKEMQVSRFNPSTVAGVDDYSHNIDINGDIQISLISDELKDLQGKTLQNYLKELYTNTVSIITNYYKHNLQTYSEYLPRLLSSMWFVLQKEVQTDFQKSLAFSLHGTADKISSFIEVPNVAVLTDGGDLIATLYNGEEIPSMGNDQPLGLLDGLVYPPNSKEFPELNFIRYNQNGEYLYIVKQSDALQTSKPSGDQYTDSEAARDQHILGGASTYDGYTVFRDPDLKTLQEYLSCDAHKSIQAKRPRNYISISQLEVLNYKLKVAMEKYYG